MLNCRNNCRFGIKCTMERKRPAKCFQKCKRHYIDKSGKQVVKIWMVDTGMAFDRIVTDMGGLKMSYIGPCETVVQ